MAICLDVPVGLEYLQAMPDNAGTVAFVEVMRVEEALRRVAFLLWCAATQPACLTGVAELTESQELDVVETLDGVCKEGELDPQLRWMLGYYHGRFPAVFGRFERARALQHVLKQTFPEAWRSADREARHFEGRGLMGRFWSDVITSEERD